MNKLCFAGLALLGCVLQTDAVSAQCVRFSKDVPCEARMGPINQLHFGVVAPASQKLPSARPVTKAVAPANDVQPGIDCAMVKTPSPQFQSAMPVIKPDPSVQHKIRVTLVPPCKSK